MCFATVHQIRSLSAQSPQRCVAHLFHLNRACKLSTHLRAQQDDETVVPNTPLLSALTTIGLSGTIAVTGAALSGYQIFKLFNWNQPDILLALKINLALLLLEAVLFGPQWAAPAALAAAGDAQKTPIASGVTATTAAAAAGAAGKGSMSQQQQQHQALVDMAAVKAAGVWSLASWQLLLALYRSVLQRSQMEQLPKQATLGLTVARETSKELLQRGFVLTALAGWLTDRFYEAGLDETVVLGPQGLVALHGLELTLPQLGFWVASLVATGLAAPAAFLAAEEAAESVSGALLLKTEVGQAVAAASSGSSGGSSSTASGSSGGSETPSTAAAGQHQQQQQQGSTAASRAPAAAGEDEEEEDEELDPLVLEYRLFKVTEECVSSAPAQIAYGVTLAKEMGRTVLANASFVATGGNLAATLTCSLVLNGLLMVYAAAAGQQQYEQDAGIKP